MKKENIEEGVKRIAILIWLVWVAYWLFLHIGYPDYGSWNCENYIYLKGSPEHHIYMTNPMKAFHDYERTSWVGFWIAQGCLFYSFDAGLYFLGELFAKYYCVQVYCCASNYLFSSCFYMERLHYKI